MRKPAVVRKHLLSLAKIIGKPGDITFLKSLVKLYPFFLHGYSTTPDIFILIYMCRRL